MHTVTLRRVSESLLPWKTNKYYLLLCACVHARACEYPEERASTCA